MRLWNSSILNDETKNQALFKSPYFLVTIFAIFRQNNRIVTSSLSSKTGILPNRSMLMNYFRDDKETILLGNFNFDIALNSSGLTPRAKNFLHMTRVFHLTQIITEYTRITEHSRTLIDLFFTTRPKLYCSGVSPVGFSDHCAVFGIKKPHRIELPPPKTVKARNSKLDCSEQIWVESHGILLNLSQIPKMNGIV